MNPKNLFDLNPKLKQCFVSGNSEAFESEEDAKAHANHFNVSMKKVFREEFVVEQRSEKMTAQDYLDMAANPPKTRAEEREEAKVKVKAKSPAFAKAKEDADTEAKEEADAEAKEEADAEAKEEA